MDAALLTQTALFRGMRPEEAEDVLACLGTEERAYPKGTAVCRVGERVSALGVVLHGRVLIETCDLWGRTAVLDSVGPGQIFAEAYACLPEEPIMVDVSAAEDTQILFLEVARILQICPQTCSHHSLLIQNLLRLTAQKNLTLSRKIFYTTSKSIRGRLLAYLSDQAVRTGSRSFTIPFNRQQLADYLNVDRSALSAELGRLRREGLVRTWRSHFVLADDEKAGP